MKREKVYSVNKFTEILVVEDSPTQAAQIRYLLESNHYEVSVSPDGIQAMEWISKHKPCLIITDIIMPGMNGFELCEKIKSDINTADIPVILLTSLSDPEEVIEGLSCGATKIFFFQALKRFLKKKSFLCLIMINLILN
jgi:PleD family two-component response regulator